MNINLQTKYYYVINASLKMSKGKIAAQVSHVAMQLAERYNEIGTAVILKAKEDKLSILMSDCIAQVIPEIFHIIDAGLTEVPEGSLTCIGFKGDESTETLTRLLQLL